MRWRACSACRASPLSYLASEANSGVKQPPHTKVPLRFSCRAAQAEAVRLWDSPGVGSSLLDRPANRLFGGDCPLAPSGRPSPVPCTIHALQGAHIDQRAAIPLLGARLAQHSVRVGRQQLPPLSIAVLDLRGDGQRAGGSVHTTEQ